MINKLYISEVTWFRVPNYEYHPYCKVCLILVYFYHQLIKSALLGHRSSLWITHKENGLNPTMRARCGLVLVNDYKCSQGQRFNVDKFLFTHPMTDQRCLTFTIALRAHWSQGYRAPAHAKRTWFILNKPNCWLYMTK
jgi:hypothetical protein